MEAAGRYRRVLFKLNKFSMGCSEFSVTCHWFQSNLLQDTATLKRRQRLEQRLLKLGGITRNEEDTGYTIEVIGGSIVVLDQVP